MDCARAIRNDAIECIGGFDHCRINYDLADINCSLSCRFGRKIELGKSAFAFDQGWSAAVDICQETDQNLLQ